MTQNNLSEDGIEQQRQDGDAPNREYTFKLQAAEMINLIVWNASKIRDMQMTDFLYEGAPSSGERAYEGELLSRNKSAIAQLRSYGLDPAQELTQRLYPEYGYVTEGVDGLRVKLTIELIQLRLKHLVRELAKDQEYVKGLEWRGLTDQMGYEGSNQRIKLHEREIIELESRLVNRRYTV